MTTATQQLPSNPALDFAQSILEVTNNGLELIEILRDITQDGENATTNDRIAAANILNDRAFGKSPRQISHSAGLNPELAPATDGDSPKAKKEADSPRLVTRIDDALHNSIGPAPGASHHTKQPAPTTDSLESPEPFDPNSIHFTIQQHILDITNNGQTLRDTLLEIARACPEPVEGAEDNPKITTYHRRRAVAILLDRALGTDPNAVWNTVCPGCLQSWTTHTCSPVHPERSAAESKDDSESEEFVPDPGWIETLHEIKRMEDEGIIDNVEFDPFKPVYNWAPKEVVMPFAKEVADKFRAELDLQAERRAMWPEIEERRRKKLAQVYPSHSEDEDPPDT